MLCKHLLTGWIITKSNYLKTDILISKNNRFTLTCDTVGFEKSHKDIISIFNQLLIAISIHIIKQIPNVKLYHGAAIIENGNCFCILGAKKSGKSEYVVEKALSGAFVITDDLLIITDLGRVMCIGFPVRLRRPVRTSLCEEIKENNLIAGHSLAYINPKISKIRPAGKFIKINKILALNNCKSTLISGEENVLQTLKPFHIET